jgi:hypothetical protein
MPDPLPVIMLGRFYRIPATKVGHDVAKALISIEESKQHPPHKFNIPGGLLEEILARPEHVSRTALIWQNLATDRASVNALSHASS